MSTADASGGPGGGGSLGSGGNNVGGGGGVGSGGGPGGGGLSTNVGALNSTIAGLGSMQQQAGVAAKISHVKTLDSNLVSTSSAGGNNIQIGVGAVSGVSTIMTSSVSTAGAIKMTTAGGAIATSIGGTPIALNVAHSPTAIRTIGAGGQSTQVRVVMPTNIIPIKQFEGTAGVGRTQITAIPAGIGGATSRTVSNTSITVTRPLTQTTYFPRAGINATQMTAVGTGQRLVTPIRTGPNTGSMSAGATVTGLATAGGFVRGTAVTVNRNTSSPATSVISPATSTTWMQTHTGGQVQLIRAIPQQTQKRIITAQGMTTSTSAYSATNLGGGIGTAVSGTVVATTPPTVVQTGGGGQTQNHPGGLSTIQAVSSAGVSHSQAQSQQQQTYVATLATVLPPRQHQATLVYSSNVAATSQSLTHHPQQFNPTLASGQRLAVATQLSAAAAPIAGTASRQIRPIPLPKTISAAKLNTTSISIRAPNITSTLQPVGVGVAGGGGGAVIASGNATSTNSPRNATMSGVTTGVGSTVMPSANLPTTRIIQLQQPGISAQPIIGSTGRISANVMFQPIIVNTSGTGKLVSGLRQPVSMSAKPSLTITPFGLGKLPGGNAAQIGVNLAQQQNVTTGIQSSLGVSGSLAASVGGGGGGNSSPASGLSVSIPNSSSGGVTNLSTAQLVNVSQAAAAAAAGQLLTTQNIVSSAVGGGASVLPLAITTRGSNILTGTITPLKNANAITVGKVMAAANVANLENSSSGTSGASIITSSAGPPTNVYIHQAVSAQRTHGTSVSVSGTNLHAPSAASSSNTTVLTTTGGVGNMPASAGAFLPQGGTIYYESVAASSVQVSTGVLSLTTTTATNSTLPPTQNQLANTVPATNLAISSLPFTASASHTGNSTATFTVVPSTGGRSISQLQIPVSSAAGTQIQSVPLRFSAQLPSALQVGGNASSSNTLTADAISVSQATQQLLQQSSVPGAQQLLPNTAVAAHHAASGSTTATLTGTQGQHVVIPLQTSIKVSGGSAGSAVVSNFLRKRDADGSPIRAAKNLAPTLLSMGSGSGGTNLMSTTGSPAASSVGSAFSITSVASSSASSMASVQTTSSSALTTEALAKKDRAQAAATGGVIGVQRAARGDSPVSSDGSTTVSANSSPGVEQQMQDSNVIMPNHMPHSVNDSTHFNPINEMYANHHGNVNVHHNVLTSAGGGGGTPISSRNPSLDHHQQMHASMVSSSARLNGGPQECSTRKRSRRSTNDSQLSSHSQGSLSLPPPTANAVAVSHMNSSNNTGNNSNFEMSAASDNGGMLVVPVHGTMAPGPAGISLPHQYDGNNANANANAIVTNAVQNNASNHKNNNLPPTAGNKENAKPTEFTLRRPRNFTLLNTYKQNWKTTNNHFTRYSEVKPREERRPTVIDLANQSNVMGKINGWKIYHLSSQMEDLCENESNGYDQLSNMLKQMETHEKNPEIERINELLKGNIQRSKIIVDGVHEAQNQMMKIFEHKPHISDILHRCASKRNFKKREKY